MALSEAIKFTQDFLARRGIRHVYIGGIALRGHVESRTTRDADIIVELSTDEAADFVEDLEREGASIYKKELAGEAEMPQIIQNLRTL